jgi:hypothetical protein
MMHGPINIRGILRLKRVGFGIGFNGGYIVNKVMNFEIPRTGIY